jgi:hypothetical protein
MLNIMSINPSSTRAEVLAAVQNDGSALRWASDDLAEDREVVLAAVQNDGGALRWASDDLKEDREVVLAAVKNNGGALKCASDELRADPVLRSWAGLTRLGSAKRRLREAVTRRAIVRYWEKCAVERSHAPGGAGRKRDLDAFESDFGEAS